MDNQLALYKSIIDDAVDAIFIGDEKGNFIIVNKSAEQLTGYTRAELLELNMSNLFPLKILTKSPLKYKSLDSNQVITSERQIVRKNETLVLVEMKSKKLESGNYQSFIRDISERKQKDNELNDNEEKYKTLFELSPAGILLEDSDGTIIDANPAIHKNFGYDGKSLIGKNIKVIAPPETHTEVQNNIQKILDGESLKHIVRSIKKDGSGLYNELYETKISLPEIGVGILSISNDITKQVLAEQKLRASELNYKELFEYASIPFLEEDVTELFNFYDDLEQNGITDIRKHFDNNPNLLTECINKIKPIKINQAGLNLFGFRNIEDYKNNIETIFTPNSLKVFKEQIIAFSKGIKTFSAETETVTSSGEKKHLVMKIQLQPKTQSGRQIELFSLIDITEQKRNSELLQQHAQELETLFHLSEEMIGNLNVSEIINAIPKFMVQASSITESASMWAYNESKDNFEVVSSFGYGKRKIDSFTLPKENTIIGEIFESKKAIICNDIAKDPRYKKESGERDSKTKATVGVPLISENKVSHIIFADNFTEANVFNDRDLKVLQSFANMATIAITNAQLYDKIIESEEKYRSIFDSSGESIFIHELETGKILDVNKKMLETYGLTYEEALNANPNDSSSGVYPYTGEEAFKKVQKAKTEGPQLFEWHAKKKNGDLFWTEVNLQKAKIANNERIVAVVRDITERKEKEKEIYYQASLLDSANDAIIASFDKTIKDKLNNKISFWNKGAEKLYGWKKEEVLGKNIRDVIVTEIIDDTYENISEKLKETGFWAGETIQYDKKGNKKYIHLSVSSIIENGVAIGAIGVNHDITEKKIIEDAIKESESKMQGIMRGAPVGIGFVKNRILEFVNDHLLLLLGYTKEEMIGKNSKIFYASLEHYDKIGNLYNKLQNNKTASEETQIKNKSGEIIDIILTLSPIDDGDPSKGSVFSVLNITENKRNERKIKLEQLRYKNLFENSPVPLWEEDFTEVYSKIEELKNAGVSDLRKFFYEDPERIYEFLLLPIVLNVNQATLDLYKAKDKDELLGSLQNIFSENSIELFKEEIIAIFNGEEYFQGEGEVRTLDNKTLFIDVRLYIDYNNSSNTEGYKALLATIDITERKNEERKKKELEVSYYDIFNNSSDAIYVQDKNGCFIDVNNGVIEMYGYTKDEMIGKTHEFVSADGKNDLEKISNYIKDAFNNKPVQFEFWGKRKNGEIFPKLVRVKKGSYLGQDVVIAFALDITDQKKYEQELKRWADVFKYSKWGIVVGSPHKRELEMMNPAFAEMHGYTIEELQGKQVEMLFTPKERAKVPTFIKEANEKGNINFETEHLRKDGSSFPIFANVTITKDKEGNLLHRIVNIHDITELKEAEKVIEQERDQAQKYLDVAGVLLGVLDVNGTITLMNKKGLEILGYKEKELIGKNWFEIALPKEYVNEVKKVFTKTMSGKLKNIEYYENPILAKGGDIKIIAFHNTVLRNYDSEIIGVLFSGEDITERKLIQESLRKSELNLKEAQKIAKIGHWELDLIENKLDWSDEVYRIFNLKSHEFGATYETFLSNIHPDDKEFVNKEFSNSVENKTPYNIAHRLLLKNNSIKYVREIGQTFYDENDNPLRSIGTVQDITDIVIAEKEVTAQLEKNQLILNTINDGFILADEQGKIVDVNPAYCNLIGYSFEELKTMNIRTVEVSIPKEEVDARIQRMISKGFDSFETQHISKNGNLIDLAVSISITSYENKSFVAAFLRDITLQKEALENLKRSKEEMDELAQHLQDVREEERHGIATEIHDDLGQTLTALKLDTSILISKLPDADPEIIKKLFAMKDLTDHTIKTVQKISSELRPGILDDLGLSDALEWEIGKFEERTSINCKLKLTPVDISFDKQLNVTIFRLFQESLTNVARHANATELDVKIIQKTAKINITIKDNGVGISTEQVNNHKSFGLVGMRERLKKISGDINFTSEPNKGTTVKIVIPFLSKDV